MDILIRGFGYLFHLMNNCSAPAYTALDLIYRSAIMRIEILIILFSKPKEYNNAGHIVIQIANNLLNSINNFYTLRTAVPCTPTQIII